MKITPKFVGYVEIPTHLKDYGNALTKRLVHELVPGRALQLELPDAETARQFQRAVLMAGMREFGQGHVVTGIEGNQLYIWLRLTEPDPLEGLEALRTQAEQELENNALDESLNRKNVSFERALHGEK